MVAPGGGGRERQDDVMRTQALLVSHCEAHLTFLEAPSLGMSRETRVVFMELQGPGFKSEGKSLNLSEPQFPDFQLAPSEDCCGD